MTDFFSTAEVAKALKVSRIAIHKKIMNGRIKASKVGRNYVIPKEEVLKLLGKSIGEENKSDIDKAVRRAVKEYGDVFKKLGKE
jgi:excisionase family DNA binding protein